MLTLCSVYAIYSVLFENFADETTILYKWVVFNDRSIFGCKLNDIAFRI